MQHLTFDKDFNKEEILEIFKLAKELKDKQKKGEPHELLKSKSLAMIFQKPSTRTRVSFEVAMEQLGGHALNLAAQELQLGRGETVSDTAKVLSGYVDGIMARVFSHQDIIELAKNSSVPIINGLSDKFHPCQALTDLFTILEKRGNLENLTLVFVGDGDNNVTNSLLLICDILGVKFKIACPDKYMVQKEIINLAGNKVEISNDPKTIVKNADVIYTDTWVSMGRNDEKERIEALTPYQVNRRLISLAKKEVLVMHCLPAHRNHEITDEVMDGPHSIVFDQAENRLHVQKAILVKLLL